MPWVYKLQLNEYKPAGEIQTDWEGNIPGNASINNSHGGVCASSRDVGGVAVIVSERNNPEFQQMENLPYVDSITESHEIPERGQAEFDPPVDLAFGIRLAE